jgi:hypothetical protein
MTREENRALFICEFDEGRRVMQSANPQHTQMRSGDSTMSDDGKTNRYKYLIRQQAVSILVLLYVALHLVVSSDTSTFSTVGRSSGQSRPPHSLTR